MNCPTVHFYEYRDIVGTSFQMYAELYDLTFDHSLIISDVNICLLIYINENSKIQGTYKTKVG
jgi:hypothetical protein